jgi:hypothetical protein
LTLRLRIAGQRRLALQREYLPAAFPISGGQQIVIEIYIGFSSK